MSKNQSIELVSIVGGLLVGLSVIAWAATTVDAQPRDPKRTFTATQSGGNCVYIVDGKYANFIAVVPVGQGGC
jgi:hypothetical protein